MQKQRGIASVLPGKCRFFLFKKESAHRRSISAKMKYHGRTADTALTIALFMCRILYSQNHGPQSSWLHSALALTHASLIFNTRACVDFLVYVSCPDCCDAKRVLDDQTNNSNSNIPDGVHTKIYRLPSS